MTVNRVNMVSRGAVKLAVTISKIVEKERIPTYARRDNLVAFLT